MLDIGSFELLLILVLSLIILGPEQLKSIAKYSGKVMSKFRRMSDEFKKDIEANIDDDELKQSLKEIRGDLGNASAGFDDDYIKEGENGFVDEYMRRSKK